MATADPILEALSKALLDPTPRVLIGNAKSPGIFVGTPKKMQPIADECLAAGWIVQTGEFAAKKKPLFRITENGIKHAIENSEPVTLLREIRDNIQVIVRLRDRFEAAFSGLNQQEKLMQAIEKRLLATKPSEAPKNQPHTDVEWKSAALQYIRSYQQSNPTAYCPLPELYQQVVKPKGQSIGQFHDGIREMLSQAKIRLFPYTRPFYTMDDEQYALVVGQEIKYYVQLNDESA